MINWLIEEFSRDNSFLEIKDAAERHGHNVKIVGSLAEFSYPEMALFPQKSNVLFLGSIQCAKQLQKFQTNHCWLPGVWCTWENYCCTKYYAHWGQHVLNRDYFLMPLADFNRKYIYETRNSGRNLFIRPNGGDKPFTGQVWTLQDLNSRLWEISTDEMKPDDLLLIAAKQNIGREWRVVCSEGSVITGSRYKTHGMVDYRRELPDEVRDFAEMVIQTKWKPDPIYMMDICEGPNGLALLEIGPFNTSGLYHCDFDAIVRTVENIYKDFYGVW